MPHACGAHLASKESMASEKPRKGVNFKTNFTIDRSDARPAPDHQGGHDATPVHSTGIAIARGFRPRLRDAVPAPVVQDGEGLERLPSQRMERVDDGEDSCRQILRVCTASFSPRASSNGREVREGQFPAHARSPSPFNQTEPDAENGALVVVIQQRVPVTCEDLSVQSQAAGQADAGVGQRAEPLNAGGAVAALA